MVLKGCPLSRVICKDGPNPSQLPFLYLTEKMPVISQDTFRIHHTTPHGTESAAFLAVLFFYNQISAKRFRCSAG